MTKYIIGALLALAIYLAGFYSGKRGDPLPIESVRIDTLRVEVPIPMQVTPKLNEGGEQVVVIAQLPIVELSTPESSETQQVVRVVDTLAAQVPISLYDFSGEGWSASVSGYDVTMERMDVYHTTTTLTKPPMWEVALIGGVDPYTYWVGGSATRRWGRFRASVDVGWNLKNSAPYVGVSGGITLFSR